MTKRTLKFTYAICFIVHISKSTPNTHTHGQFTLPLDYMYVRKLLAPHVHPIINTKRSREASKVSENQGIML